MDQRRLFSGSESFETRDEMAEHYVGEQIGARSCRGSDS